jgi:hypothetical protein
MTPIRLKHDLVEVTEPDSGLVWQGYFMTDSRLGIIFMTTDKSKLYCALTLESLINGNYTVSVKGK